MSFEHIMLDLETLSTKRDAFIVSVGAVRFDIDSFEVAQEGSALEFYTTIDLEDEEKEKYGLRISVDTVKWWMSQSKEAQTAFFTSGKRMTDAFAEFNRFVKMTDPVHTMLWGNGATFDNVILRGAYDAAGMTFPLAYKNDMCYRTMRRQFAHLSIPDEQSGTAHNALDDARSQAKKLVKIFEALEAPRCKMHIGVDDEVCNELQSSPVHLVTHQRGHKFVR